MLNICFVGDTLAKDKFPMRGIPQTLFRELFRINNETFNFYYVSDSEVSNYNFNVFDVIVIMISDGWNKDFYQKVHDNKIDLSGKKLIGYSTELFDVWNRKSQYEYFNYYHQYAYRKGIEYGIFNKLSGVISPSRGKVPGYERIPHIYYPFLFAPSVYEDKIPYMRNFIGSNPKLTGTLRKRNISMVYKLGSPARDLISDKINSCIPITYGGKYKNNDDGVKGGYEFDIVKDYYNQFNFNLAIENEFVYSYWTEKIINPLIADSVPIYYDPFDMFPIEIINKNAIVRLTDKNLDVQVVRIKRLIEEYTYKETFSDVEIFTKDALNLFNITISEEVEELQNALW